jgi:hypothetical protein
MHYASKAISRLEGTGVVDQQEAQHRGIMLLMLERVRE